MGNNNYIAPIEGTVIKSPNLVAAHGVKDYTNGRQLGTDAQGNEYQENQYNIGTPQYYTDWSLIKKTSAPSSNPNNPVISGSSVAEIMTITLP